jgi:hypothetical protein
MELDNTRQTRRKRLRIGPPAHAPDAEVAGEQSAAQERGEWYYRTWRFTS